MSLDLRRNAPSWRLCSGLRNFTEVRSWQILCSKFLVARSCSLWSWIKHHFLNTGLRERLQKKHLQTIMRIMKLVRLRLLINMFFQSMIVSSHRELRLFPATWIEFEFSKAFCTKKRRQSLIKASKLRPSASPFLDSSCYRLPQHSRNSTSMIKCCHRLFLSGFSFTTIIRRLTIYLSPYLPHWKPLHHYLPSDR